MARVKISYCSVPPPIGYLLGGHVMRLFHGHDEVVTLPGSDQSEEQQRCVHVDYTNLECIRVTLVTANQLHST